MRKLPEGLLGGLAEGEAYEIARTKAVDTAFEKQEPKAVKEPTAAARMAIALSLANNLIKKP